MANRKEQNHQFYIVCMLNALFGNPNIHLIQLSKDYRGPKTFEFDFKKYQAEELVGAEDDLAVMKKRRNAVTELLRFICQQEFPAQELPAFGVNPTQVYRRVTHLLLCGDIKEATKTLTKNKMFKLALIVSQSVHNTRLANDQWLRAQRQDPALNELIEVMQSVFETN